MSPLMPRRETRPAQARPLRVVLADDDEEFRDAVAGLLGAFDWIEVVGTARDGEEAVRLFSKTTPDVVVMDLMMPGLDGVEATKQIVAADPQARVLILTGSEDERALALCIRAGARACLRKEPLTARMLPLMLALMKSQVVAAATPSEGTQKPDRSDARARTSDIGGRRVMTFHRYFPRFGGAACAAVAFAFALAGCGGDDPAAEQAALAPTVTPEADPTPVPDGGEPAKTVVKVSVGEWFVKPEAQEAASGAIEFEVANDGAVEHELEVVETDVGPGDIPVERKKADVEAVGEERGEVEDIEAGATKEFTVELDAGSYLLVCNLPGHYEGGMVTAFEVK